MTFPARGTWIEILNVKLGFDGYNRDVPRKGNVDRNAKILVHELCRLRRSPQGERG